MLMQTLFSVSAGSAGSSSVVRVMGVPHALGVLLLVLGIVDSTRPGQVHEEDGVPVLERSNTLDDTFESLGQSVFGDGYDATSNISLLDPLGESTAGAELSDDSDASIDELGTSRDIESWTFDTQLTSTPSKKATFQDVQHLSHVFATPRACRSVRECLMGKPICLYMYSYHTRYPDTQKRSDTPQMEQTNSFSKCTKCTSLERQLEQSLSPKIRGEIMILREEHNQHQMLERKYYYSKREASRKSPDQYLSLIIDGMDQSKSNLPHFIGRQAKIINPADLLKTHITGVINHGQGTFHTFLDYNQYAHYPNLTINLLLLSLKQAAAKAGNTLPATLYIQADNCWRENKNKYVMAFCELLVRKDIFREVHLSFLYVGHTHEDVDAAFSRIAEKLRRNDAETIPEILDLLPNPGLVETMFDVREWLSPMINVVQKHTQPLHFKIQRTGSDIKAYYKGQQDKPWELMDNTFMDVTPAQNSKPKLMKPTVESINFERLDKQMKQLTLFFKSKDSLKWWCEFVKEKGLKSKTSKWILNDLPHQPVRADAATTSDVPIELRQMIDDERANPTVICKQPKKSKTKRRNQPSMSQGKKKPQSKRKKQHVVRTVMNGRTVMITMDRDQKKHIWILIFMDLIGFYLTLIYIWICGLLEDIVELLNLLWNLWCTLVAYHIGNAIAAVAITIPTLEHTSYYAVSNMCC